MFRLLNKMIKDNSLTAALKSSKGQVAVILILVIAAALIFYAVSLNFGRYSAVKSVVTIASDTSTGIMASGMASYGQKLSETYLGGAKKKCAFTGILSAIITIIIIIIIIVTHQYELLWLVLAALALAVVSFILQVLVVQPGITSAWNRIINKTLSTSNQFTETAIQSALGKAVADPVQVPDVNDIDGDRIWTPDPADLDPADTISRFGAYYTERLRRIKGEVPLDVKNFLDALSGFVHDGGDGWGLHDPVRPEECFGTAECHPCCVPAAIAVEGEPEPEPVRPEECDAGTDWAAVCGDASPYGRAYPWVYDPYYENPNNGFVSFREQIGRDDEHQLFSKEPADPNGAQTKTLALSEPPLPPVNFHLEDATNFYAPPVYSPGTDNKKGIYPFFYKIADWGVDLTRLDPSERGEHCSWYDERYSGLLDCPPVGSLPLEISLPLRLPNDPTTLIYNTNPYVDSVSDNTMGEPPLSPDKVTLPGNILARDDECAQTAVYPEPSTDMGFWKRGGDQFCSAEDTTPDDPAGTTWPYFAQCSKDPGGCTEPGADPGDPPIPVDCACEDVEDDLKKNFPEDALDDLVYKMGDFIGWAESLVTTGLSDIKAFSKDLPNWYPQAAEWIEPKGEGTAPDEGVPCFVCDQDEEGMLYVWFNTMIEMKKRIEGWINNHDAVLDVDKGYAGDSCEEVWCVPPGATGACAEVPSAAPDNEYATFNPNFNNVQGDVEDIVSCLDYNVEGYDYVAAAAFQDCLGSCNAANCTRGEDGGPLPEKHLDGITPYEYPDPLATPLTCSPWDMTNAWYAAVTRNLALAVNPRGTQQGNGVRFEKCGDTCSLADCYHLPRSLIPPALYDPQDYQPVDVATADGNWRDITAFNDCLNNCGAENCKVGPRLPAGYDYSGLPPFDEGTDCVGGRLAGTSPWYTAIQTHLSTIVPKDEADVAAFLKCFDNCSVANCSVMPEVHSGDGTLYAWTAPPSTFTSGDCAGWAPGNQWYDDIIVNLLDAGGPSCNLNAGGWLDLTRQSALEAQNQVAKFQKRRDFLAARLAEANNIIAILDEAIDKFNEFLTGPAEALIRARIRFNQGETGLPFQAVYGWRDPSVRPEGGGPEIRGKWHIVKVEARLPGACETACGTSQVKGSDPDWPKIKTYTKHLGFTRCYELDNRDGVVKFRTTRYDEEKTSGFLSFPNGTPLWRFRWSHPQRPQDMPDYDSTPTSLDGACDGDDVRLNKLPTGASADGIYEGAFMMEEYTEDNKDCWNLAHHLLTRGVVSETCAQYGWYDGMDFKFVPCKKF